MHKRGDTLIEVMLAVSVFSLVAVGSITIMNKGIAIAQRSLEITLVRQQLDAQAEMLRFAHSRALDNDSTYNTMWSDLKSQAVVNPVKIVGADSCPAGSDLGNSFTLTPSGSGLTKLNNATYSPAETYAKVEDGVSYGISIQLTRLTSKKVYDAHIQACWYGIGLEKPMTIGTIVRLYDPEA